MPTKPPGPPHQLFALVKFLGLDQNTVAARCGVSHTMVSLWAHGRKPIPAHHRQHIGEMILQGLTQAYNALAQEYDHAISVSREAATLMAGAAATQELARRQAEDMEDCSVLQDTSWTYRQASQAKSAEADAILEAAQARQADLERHLDAWVLEQYLLSGALHSTLYEHCRRLTHYGTLQPVPLAPEDRQQLKTACETILQHLRYLDRLPELPAQAQELRQAGEARLRLVRAQAAGHTNTAS